MFTELKVKLQEAYDFLVANTGSNRVELGLSPEEWENYNAVVDLCEAVYDLEVFDMRPDEAE